MLLACVCAGWAQASASQAAAQPSAQQQTSPQLPPTPDRAQREQRQATERAAESETSRIAKYAGYIISNLAFADSGRKDQQGLLGTLPLKAGEPLDRQKLRAAIEQLYASNRFRSIQAVAIPGENKTLAIEFVVQENLFIGTLALTGGPRPPTSSQLLNAAKLALGEEYDTDTVQQAIERMKRVMAENGYFQCEIRMDSKIRKEEQLIDLYFTVERGHRAHIGKVEITGDPGIPPAQLLKSASFEPGHTVSAERATRALQKLRKKYQKEDRLESQVSIVDRNYHPDTNLLDYTFHVERGPRVHVSVEGAPLRAGLVKRYIPVFQENAVDDDLLNEGRRNLRDYFQTNGYFDVAVNWSLDTKQASDQRFVFYQIDRGERHKLTDLVISGNHYFDIDTIRERMSVQPANLLLRYGRYSQSLLARDVDAITALYKANGFERVAVTTEVEDDYKGKTGRLRVDVKVDEGEQTRVAGLDITGNQKFSLQDIEGVLTLLKGQPYSDVNLGNDRDAISNLYFNQGFPEVQVDARSEPLKGEPTRRTVSFKITEGGQVFVDNIVVSGLKYTKPFIVTQEYAIHPGEPLNQSAVLETQRKLYDLTIFNQVDVAVQNPEGDTDRKNLLMQVEEARRYTFNYGIGFEVQTGNVNTDCSTQVTNPQGQHFCNPQGATGFSPRISFDVTRVNFRGRNHTLLFKTHLGRLQQRVLTGYEQPNWLNNPNLILSANAFYDNTRDVLTFSSKRLEGAVQVTQKLGGGEQGLVSGQSLVYRFSYRRVSVDQSTLAVSESLIPVLARPVRVGIPSLAYVRDHRDNAIDSHKGYYTTVEAGVASKIFGSESSFSRLSFQNASYYPFAGGRTPESKWVFARSTRVGFAEAFGTVAGQPGFVPLPERFFGGGGNSHRGFAINQSGPRDPQTGFPVGGDSIFLNNLELRTPPLPLPIIGDNLSAVLFHDSGNVFTSAGDLTTSVFRFSQPNQRNCRNLAADAPKCEFNYLSQAIGTGIRYKTPIGPVRIDLGYNLNPPVFPVRIDVVKGPHSETVRRLNLFFSIGQTF